MASFDYMDWETRGPDLTEIGALNYALDLRTEILLLSWAIDGGLVRLWCPDFSKRLVPEVWAYVSGRMHCWGAPPAEIVEFCKRPEGYHVAWNMGFDRAIWQNIATPDHGFPEIAIEQTLDAMSQGLAANLPGKLDQAGRALGIGQKTLGGTGVMKRFADIDTPLPGSLEDILVLMDKNGGHRDKAVAFAIELWALYLDYSDQDTYLLRDVFETTRPLDATEWQEYWVSEKVNARGLHVDLDICHGAVRYRQEEAEFVKEECLRLTGGMIAGPTFSAQISKWLFAQVPQDLQELMVKERNPETQEVTRLTSAKNVLTRMLEDINDSDTPPPDNVTEFIELMQFGRSSSAVKFQKIINQQVDHRLCNSYVFNGAGQTGRKSSRGVQIHNLPRDAVPNELDVLDMTVAGVPIETLRQLPLTIADQFRNNRPLTSVNALLGRLIRPTFTAPHGRMMVWGDWAQIECRVTPWLANSDAAFDAVLTPFINGDDLYILNAAEIFNVDPMDLMDRCEAGDPEAKRMRQAGKVAVLALGFLGGVGALRAMARGYGMRFSDEEAQKIVYGWRDRNTWARKFGNKCEEAAFHAMNAPLALFPAGLLKYQYNPDLMGGTLVCFLPDMRPITYPMAKIAKVERFGEERDTITYLNDMGRRSLWNGLQVENGTQATAASVLRATLLRVEDEAPGLMVGDTHDEIICEVEESQAERFAKQLEEIMTRGFSWSDGLPLAADVTVDWFYTKDDTRKHLKV